MNNFVSLHTHTDASTLDGMADIPRLVNRVKELGMSAIGISDHGNMIKTLDFQEECIKQGVKPIIGCEFYIGEEGSTDTFHLLAIAKNNIGLRNLYKLNTFAYMKNFYYKPRITFEKLLEHKEGLIVTTACLGSEFGQNFIDNKPSETMALALKFNNIFGEDFYLEIQPNSIPIQKDYNNYIVNLANGLDIPLIVTCDAHYVTKEDSVPHDVMLAMQVKKKLTDEKRFRFNGSDYYIKTDEEIINDLSYLPKETVIKAINNTQEIAAKCNAHIETGLNLLPKFITGADEDFVLAQHCNKGFTNRINEGMPSTKEYVDRVRYELSIIKQKGYAGYYLIVEDYVNYAKTNGILVGDGRGSGSGSLIAYLLRITNVDPIKYGLYFERFLNPDRNSLPDFDVDFSYTRRHEVVEYVRNKYGNECTAQIMAEGTMACNAVVRKVLSTYGYEQKYINSICKTIPKELGITLSKACEMSEQFKTFMIKHNEEYRIMLRLEGLMSHTGKHAAGVIICNNPIDDFAPCMRDEDDHSMLKTQWDKHKIENVGLVKFDFLSLKTLSVIDIALNNIKKEQGLELNLDNINLDDEKLYETLNNGDIEGIFQFCEPSGKKIIEKAKPKRFSDIIACESIMRPGVVESDMYIYNKEHGYEKTGNKIVDDILEDTYGAIVYQEQTMLLMNKLTGGRWTLGKADSMRKVKNIEEYREDFISNCVANNVDKDFAEKIFNRFSFKYSFNKSHACCYAVISIKCAYLLTYYRKEFMAAVMSIEMLNTDNNLPNQIKECHKYNINILPPDINESMCYFNPTEEGIRFPITAIQGVGNVAAEIILKNKINGAFEYENLKDFLSKVPKNKVNKKVVTSLIKAGAFDKIEPEYMGNRNKILEYYYSLINEKQELLTWSDDILINYEKELLGFPLSKHPLDGFDVPPIELLPEGEIQTVGIITSVKKILDKNSNEMAFVMFENKANTFEGIIFAYIYQQYSQLIVDNSKVIIKGKKDGKKVLVNELRCL